MEQRVVWVVMTPSKDLPGEWVSVIPELGIVSQGTGPRVAADAALVALHNVIKWDSLDNVDTFSARDQCPEDHPVWDRLFRLLMSKTRVKFRLHELGDHARASIFAFQVPVDVVANLELDDEEIAPETTEPWMITGLEKLRHESCPPS